MEVSSVAIAENFLNVAIPFGTKTALASSADEEDDYYEDYYYNDEDDDDYYCLGKRCCLSLRRFVE